MSQMYTNRIASAARAGAHRGAEAAKKTAPQQPLELWQRVPPELRVEVIEFNVSPWSEVFYLYPTTTQRRLDLRGLPEPMRQEIVSSLWLMHQLGERIRPVSIAIWKNLIPRINELRIERHQRPIESLNQLTIAEWLSSAGEIYHRRDGGTERRFKQHEHVIARLYRAVVAQNHQTAWWQTDIWDLVRDPRIPRHTHQTRATVRVHWGDIEPSWLRDAVRWWLAMQLSRGSISWSTAVSYKSELSANLSPFLVSRGIDSPTLVTGPATELSGLGQELLAHLRSTTLTRGNDKGQPLTSARVTIVRKTINRFYSYMFTHRANAAHTLGEPRWLDLTESHQRLLPDSRDNTPPTKRSRRRSLSPASVSHIKTHLDLIAMPIDQTKTIVANGNPRRINGLDDPQAMRALQLMTLTGRPITEILLLGPDPLIPMACAPNSTAPALGLHFQYTINSTRPALISADPLTISVVRDQQQWLRENIIPHLSRTETGEPSTPKYLFLAIQNNQRGLRPYHPNVLARRLTTLFDRLGFPAGLPAYDGVSVPSQQRRLSAEQTCQPAARLPTQSGEVPRTTRAVLR